MHEIIITYKELKRNYKHQKHKKWLKQHMENASIDNECGFV